MHFNPRAPRGARRIYVTDCLRIISISIHVPREGHDYLCPGHDRLVYHFNPRAPRGARHYQNINLDWLLRFQSTCPARGTTIPYQRRAPSPPDFNPRAPRGARRTAPTEGGATTYFNPRAPRGARHDAVLLQARCPLFQSTCPARGTTAVTY